MQGRSRNQDEGRQLKQKERRKDQHIQSKAIFIIAMLFRKIRAHESGGYEKHQGSWSSTPHLSGQARLVALEDASKCAMAMLWASGPDLEHEVKAQIV